MFEKEAEEKGNEYIPLKKQNVYARLQRRGYKDGFQKGAEFGYNKANEWHYNGVPENENDILCQIDKDIFVVGYFHQKNKQYYTTSGEWLETVIAWKEIVLPKLAADIICCVLIIAGKENIDMEYALTACMEKNYKRAIGEGDK